MINSLLYSVYAQARARTPARHALAILYAAAAALRAPRKLSPKQAFNTVQTGHARRCLKKSYPIKRASPPCAARPHYRCSAHTPQHAPWAEQRRPPPLPASTTHSSPSSDGAECSYAPPRARTTNATPPPPWVTRVGRARGRAGRDGGAGQGRGTDP